MQSKLINGIIARIPSFLNVGVSPSLQISESAL